MTKGPADVPFMPKVGKKREKSRYAEYFFVEKEPSRIDTFTKTPFSQCYGIFKIHFGNLLVYVLIVCFTLDHNFLRLPNRKFFIRPCGLKRKLLLLDARSIVFIGLH